MFFYEFLALLRTQNLSIEQGTASTIDQILAEEDRFYLDALSLNYLRPITVSLFFSLSNSYCYCCCSR